MAVAEPLVSVLVPAYRCETFIGECLRSVMAQSYAHLELIVVDDCSPDSTFEVAVETVRDWPRATVFRNEENLGNRENFRRLLGLGRGPLVKFLCADDLLAPDAVARLVSALESDPAIGLATSRRVPIDEVGAVLPLQMLPQPPVRANAVVDGHEAGNHLLRNLRNWIGEPTTVLFRRSLLPLGGLYDLGSAAPSRNLDVVWWLKILQRSSLAVVADTLSSFRQHGGQVTKQVGTAELVLAWYDIIVGARHIGFLGDGADELTAWTSFAGMLNAHGAELALHDPARARTIVGAVTARLTSLCAA